MKAGYFASTSSQVVDPRQSALTIPGSWFTLIIMALSLLVGSCLFNRLPPLVFAPSCSSLGASPWADPFAQCRSRPSRRTARQFRPFARNDDRSIRCYCRLCEKCPTPSIPRLPKERKKERIDNTGIYTN